MDPYISCFRFAGSTKLTCGNCRLRKVKCDGRLGECQNCERLGFTCSFSNEDEGDQVPSLEARPKRQRGRRACEACRSMKVRCSGTLPSCSNCKRRHVECFYPPPKRPLRALSPEDSNSSVESSSGFGGLGIQPDRTAQAASIADHLPYLVDMFIEQIYPIPSYSFLHPPSIKDKATTGQLELPLASAICGMAALHSRSTRADNGLSWIQFAEQAIWQEFESLTIPLLQTLILVIQYRIESGGFQRAFMLLALAGRSAAVMRLNHEHPTLSLISQEIRRRIMWSLKILERYFSIGLPEFELVPFESIYLQPPRFEEEFNPGASGDQGAYSLCIRLESVRRDIMKLSRNISLCDQPYPQLPKLVHDFEIELTRIGTEMPTGASYESMWVARSVHMLLSWHQCYCDMYRLLIPGYPEAAPEAVLKEMDPSHRANAEQVCFDHATSMVRILANLNMESATAHRLEFDTAICAYHATRLILFISRHGSDRTRPAPEFAMSRAELCITALKRFYAASILVKPIIEDMETSLADFRSNGTHSNDQPSSESNEARCDPAAQLSSAAKIRQRLAIHSLLRQADFSDHHGDEPSNESNSGSPTSTRDDSALGLPQASTSHTPRPPPSSSSSWYPIVVNTDTIPIQFGG